jgi:Flp pilus assembly pilin Flp
MSRRTKSRKNATRRGAVLVEYAFLLTFFAIPVMMGISAAGVKLLREYKDFRTEVLRPFP